VDLAELLNRPFPWRTATLVAGAVALAELFGLIALAGVHLAPTVRASAGTHAQAATAPTRAPAKADAHPARPRSHLSVLVLNGNGVSGAAGTEATRLEARGYRHAIPADAPNQNYAQSLVLFKPGYLPEARRLARDAGIRIVSPLDGRTRTQLRGSQLVVILGGS
jgi:LytR cell envelope-related transcriptional attenuator